MESLIRGKHDTDVVTSDDENTDSPGTSGESAPVQRKLCDCDHVTRLLHQILSRLDTITHDITGIKEELKRLNKPTIMAEKAKVNQGGSLMYKTHNTLY